MKGVERFLPFLRWFPMRGETIKSDLLAGITVALVLIPQSMAYAQLAGLPAYYGLYAAFLPGIIAALWGSSAQLATGPVAVVSLLTASTLAPLAATGSSQFIALAILMAMMVGIIQLALGVFKLGVVVNFLSHPVVVGFTNAAAIIIGLSQLNKIFGVSMGRSEHFIQDIWGVLLQVGDTHIPTLIMGVSAFAIMWGLKKFAPKLPGVLIAVTITTIVSWSIGFEHNGKGQVEEIVDTEVRTLANEFSQTEAKIDQLNNQISAKSVELKQHEKAHEGGSQRSAALKYELELLKLELKDAEGENRKRARSMRKFIFEQVPSAAGQPAKLYLHGQVPQGEKSDGYRWRIKKVSKGELKLVGGGEVVGAIPAGLPKVDLPAFSWDMMATLFSGALVISLVGFMEAISIAKAMAAKTKDRINPNQELIGQGVSNIIGKHAWHTHKHDGIAAVVTFIATLAFAPHLDNGIMVGAGLAIVLYLYRTMTPRVAILGRGQDGTLRDAQVHNLPVSEYIIAIRYDGSLYFANVAYFEDTILEAVANSPNAKHLLIVSEGINQLDASGDEVIHHVVERLRSNGMRVVFSGLKKQVIDVMRHSGLYEYIGQENIFPDEDKALDSIYPEVLAVDPNAQCRLMKRSHIGDTDGVKTWL